MTPDVTDGLRCCAACGWYHPEGELCRRCSRLGPPTDGASLTRASQQPTSLPAAAAALTLAETTAEQGVPVTLTEPTPAIGSLHPGPRGGMLRFGGTNRRRAWSAP